MRHFKQTNKPTKLMQNTNYEIGQTVTFGKYSEGTTKEEEVFSTGDKIKILEADEEGGTKDNLCYLGERESDKTQGYFFISELSEKAAKTAKKVVKKVEGPSEFKLEEMEAPTKSSGKGKKLVVKKTAKKTAPKKEVSEKEPKTSIFTGFESGTLPPDELEDLEKGATITITHITAGGLVSGTVEIDGKTVEGLFSKAEAGLEDREDEEKTKSSPVVAKKVAKPAPAAESEAPVDIKHAPSIKKVLGESAASALKAARDISERIGGDFYTLGGVLYEIKSKAYHESVKDDDGNPLTGQPGFEQFIRLTLGVEYRMAQHYINVYEVTRRAGIPESKVKGLKCSKVVALLDLIKGDAITKDNWDEWADKAKSLKGDAYKEEVSRARVDAGIVRNGRGATGDKVRFTFVLFEDRAGVANKALAMAKDDLPPNEDGSEHSNSEAFDHILSEWARMKAEIVAQERDSKKPAK